jgi:hypothetical protein
MTIYLTFIAIVSLILIGPVLFLASFAPMPEFKTTESQIQGMRDFIKDAEAYVNSLPDMEVSDEYY